MNDALRILNARRSALRAVRLAYRKVLTKRTTARLAAFHWARVDAHALGCTVRETNAIVRTEWARRADNLGSRELLRALEIDR